MVKRLVVVGASSGGIEALRTLAAGITRHFSAAVCVVLHTSPQSPGILDAILNRASVLPAITAASGMRLEGGRIYVAPPDHHLLIEPGVLRLSKGPKENRFRPAIDPLFRTAAQVYGPAVIGVVLSGNLGDGTAGLITIKQLGGTAIVQDPDDALFPSMPQSALTYVSVDHVAPVSHIGPLLADLVSRPIDEMGRVPIPKDVEVEVKIAREENPVDAGLGEVAEPSPFTCPECHGVLLRLKQADPLRFRCHTGHAFSADSLLAAINDGIEASLWSTMRALQEGSLLVEHLAVHVKERGDSDSAGALAQQVETIQKQIEVVRNMVTERAGLTTSATVPARR
jgi:two-component system chemotaxis response regulator CheB